MALKMNFREVTPEDTEILRMIALRNGKAEDYLCCDVTNEDGVTQTTWYTHIFRKRTQNEQKNYCCIQRTTQEPSALRICSKKAFVVQIPLFCKRLGGSFTRMNSCHVWRPVGALMKKEH